jgi:hypothetical protein
VSPFEDDDDAWPDEPREFDPDSLAPSVSGPETPGIDVPEAPEFDGDVPDDVARAFWSAVLLANVGLFGVCVGAMFVVFRGQLRLGGFLFGVGVLSLLFTYRRYLLFQRGHEERTAEESGGEAEDADADGNGDGDGRVAGDEDADGDDNV